MGFPLIKININKSMRQYISEDKAIYMDTYHGLFSRKLAKWAIEGMRVVDPATGRKKPIMPVPADDVMEVLASSGVKLPDECLYTAWYLYNMAIADYPKTCKTNEHRAMFVEETLCDPDGDPENVLACFEAKMCNAGVPIYWEMFI